MAIKSKKWLLPFVLQAFLEYIWAVQKLSISKQGFMGRVRKREICNFCKSKIQSATWAPYCTYICKCTAENRRIVCSNCLELAIPSRPHQLYCSRKCADQYREKQSKIVGPITLTWQDQTGKIKTHKVKFKKNGTIAIPKRLREKFTSFQNINYASN